MTESVALTADVLVRQPPQRLMSLAKGAQVATKGRRSLRQPYPVTSCSGADVAYERVQREAPTTVSALGGGVFVGPSGKHIWFARSATDARTLVSVPKRDH